MLAVTVADAPAARAGTSAVAALVPPSVKFRSVALDALLPLLVTVAVRLMASDSTGAAGVCVMPVTLRSGLAAGVPITWNSATCAPGAPVLEANLSWMSAAAPETGMVTVLPVDGLNV